MKGLIMSCQAHVHSSYVVLVFRPSLVVEPLFTGGLYLDWPTKHLFSFIMRQEPEARATVISDPGWT